MFGPAWLLILVSLGGVWWLLSDGAPESWLIGAPTLAGAMWAVHRWHAPTRRPRLGRLLLFVPYFLSHSLLGGIDVARRVLARTMRLAPAIVELPLRLPPDSSRAVFVNLVSLLPGTLSMNLEGDTLRVHALASDPDLADQLRDLETRVASLFGVSLETSQEVSES
jgi:multicomponent Na+:H+ antiporter subunit E